MSISKFCTIFLAAALTFAALDADAARRIGGGRSIGQQSSNVTQRQATPSATPATPAQSAAAPRQGTQAPAAAAQQRKPWGAMLGGLAAGLGLAWLASSLGLGAAFGNILLMLLIGMLVLAAVGFFMRRRAAASGPGVRPAMATAGGPAYREPTPAYNPQNVGNDASARPWENTATSFQGAPAAAAGGSMIGAALGGSQNWGVPDGFDSAGFIKASKANFVSLQAAWDRGDISSLRAMMTDEMLREIQSQLAERAAQGGPAGKTEVITLDAVLLGIEERQDDYMASVEFSGVLREDETGPSPFREVWNITKPKSGGGWLVAGLQALQ
ncbi:MAG: Tim44-like domain-containing protein [Comamonas sp.]